jgi:hypothetical protein
MQDIRLNTPAIMAQVKVVLKEACHSANDESIERFARVLRNLLSVEVLPAHFSVTNGVSVNFYDTGDVVDGQFIVQKQRIWYAGVVVGKRNPSCELSYLVFWLGIPHKKRKPSENPQWMSVHSLRSHHENDFNVECSNMGTDSAWTNIDEIRRMCEAGEFLVVPHAQPSETSLPPSQQTPASCSGGGAAASLPPSQQPPASRPGEGASAASDAGRPRREKKKRESESPEAGTAISRPPKPKHKEPLLTSVAQVSAVQASVPLSVNKKTFEIGDSVSFAISCLQSLDQGDFEHPNIFEELQVRITDMASTLAVMYVNPNYTKMVSDTLRELEQYEGPEVPNVPLSKVFLDLMEQYGFCVTPRMFSKAEILCIGIAMLDTRHHFVRIEQKTGVETGFRGMAFLDPRVQRVMLKRLQKYGFATSRFHPECLQCFSSVVINGGGSWLQSSDWDFSLQSRFVLDCSVQPFAVALSDCPGVLEANGLYVASRTKRNGKPVYVQVSLIEFEGGGTTARRDKNFTPFKTCILGTAMNYLKQIVLDNKGLRREPCSPRVLWCTDSNAWGVQLLPGFDTDMFVVRFNWSEGTDQAGNSTCFKRTLFDGSSMTTSMQPCNISLKIVAAAAAELIDSNKLGQRLHYFSFGTTKYAVRDADDDVMEIPSAMEPQAWHGDGPQLYDAAVYTDCGDMKLDAPSNVKRKQLFEAAQAGQEKRLTSNAPLIVTEAHHLSANSFCPLLPRLLKPFLPGQNDIFSESWSALGGLFSGTFIETVAGCATRDRDPAECEALRVPIPLGCMAPFTFYWKHRGKGDKVPGKAGSQKLKVPVHARPHDYVYCSDPRKLPTIDAEATLEFTSTCSNSAACSDPGSQLQVMECLQTFNSWSPGHEEIQRLPGYHTYFETQDELDAYVQSARNLQCQHKAHDTFACVNVTNWKIVLHLPREGLEGTKHVRVQGQVGQGNKTKQIDVIVNSADFECLTPSFFGCDGQNRSTVRYTLCSQGVAMLEEDSGLFTNSVLASLLTSATENLSANWCSATLHHLLCLLETRVLPAATLSINEHNVLVATSSTECYDLLPFYTIVGKLDTDRIMRLYTCRGVGTRIIVPDPFPVLTSWKFVALDSGKAKNKLGFRILGTLSYTPSSFRLQAGNRINAEMYTTEVAGIDSEGVVFTVNGSPYRLAGNCDATMYEDGSLVKAAVENFPVEGSWLDKGSIHRVMEDLSKCFQQNASRPEHRQTPTDRDSCSEESSSVEESSDSSGAMESRRDTAEVSAELFVLFLLFMHGRSFGAKYTTCIL